MTSNRRGFTLAELIVSLGIICLLLAVALPSMLWIQTASTMKRLDSSAEELFLFLQNEMMYIRADADLSRLSETSTPVENDLRAMSLGDGDLIPQEVFSVMSGKSCYVTYDPKSGALYELFFSESITPEELSELVSEVALHDYAVRQKYRIGYFSATGDTLSLRDNYLEPVIVAHDRGDLWLEISCRGVTAPHETVAVTLELTANGVTAKRDIYDFTIENDVLKARYLVDGFASGDSFTSRFAELGAPETVNAKVNVYVNDNQDRSSENASSAGSLDFCPMFGSLDGNTAEISNVRHLNNIRYLNQTTEPEIIQTRDIDFSLSAEDFFTPAAA